MKYRRSILPRSSAPCHNGSGSCIFLPLRKYRNRPSPARGTSWATQVLRPLPQRQRNPHFPAVAEAPELAAPCERHFSWHPGPPVLRPLPQRQRNPHFPAVAEAPELAVPCERHFPWHPGPPPHSTTAANPAFSCRCGSPGTGRPLREALPVASRSSAPCHNGSGTRIFLPLRKYGSSHIVTMYFRCMAIC